MYNETVYEHSFQRNISIVSQMGILNDFDSHKSGVFLVPDNNTWAPQLRARINCNVIKLEKNVALMQCGYALAVHEI